MGCLLHYRISHYHEDVRLVLSVEQVDHEQVALEFLIEFVSDKGAFMYWEASTQVYGVLEAFVLDQTGYLLPNVRVYFALAKSQLLKRTLKAGVLLPTRRLMTLII